MRHPVLRMKTSKTHIKEQGHSWLSSLRAGLGICHPQQQTMMIILALYKCFASSDGEEASCHLALKSTGTKKYECQTNHLQCQKWLILLSSAPGVPEKSTPESSQRNPPYVCPQLLSTSICNWLCFLGCILPLRVGAAQTQKVIPPCMQHCCLLRR